MASPSQNLYDILELPQTASRSDIRAAYHRLAKQTHPDKNPEADPEVFHALQHAYETLSDPQQRAEYDSRGRLGKLPIVPSHPFHDTTPFEDLFTSMFADDLPPGFFGGHPFLAGHHPFHPPWTQSHPQTPKWSAPEVKSPDLKIDFQCTLEDLVNGRTVITEIPRQLGCQSCNATGFHPNATLRNCRRCDGRGYQTSTQASYGLLTHTQSTCSSCGGAGSKMSSDDCCSQCRGSCITTETAVIEWEIMRGMLPGQSITLHRMGNTLPGHLPGNVVICLCVAPHPTFKMISPDSRDLLLPVTITLSESLLGMDRVLFRHLNGREIRVYMPGPHQEGHAVIKHGDLKAIRGMGLPAQTPTQSQGDLWIKFDIEWPSTEWLRLQDLSLLQSVLPPSCRDVPETDTPQEYANLESAVINKV
ncbi:hypothetical protein PGT21_023210 [Puccinia graminis f. sp. tritici]|uniref:Uncharacterized protein n=2 Tax=Puccinia graminis f. sp. tritici TaxID=56615 RepID=A0A5B0SEA0_PUCGR|nr:hypothetical protein PGT21_023210 [Puccinia graminis f. sp. tritici]KAA1136446.1 hypothetical protein PGTUg99_032199 [Puccinia graminis f. sp. tritici]